MRTSIASARRIALRVGLAGAVLAVTSAAAPPSPSRVAAGRPDARTAEVIAFWTPERRGAAIERDLVVDARGLGYLRTPEGLEPYGHAEPAVPADDLATKVWGRRSLPVPAQGPVAEALESGEDLTQELVQASGPTPLDAIAPMVTNMNPAAGATIGADYTLSATIQDSDGVKSVSFQVQYPSGATGSFAATAGANGTWSKSLTGFYDGNWKWRVVAKDSAKPSNIRTTDWVSFLVSTGGGGGTGGGTSGGTNSGVTAVSLAEWTGNGGAVQTAAGRIYFQMPANKSQSRWSGYICSGTVAKDTRTGFSIIITAAHCVYDDVNKAFARSVLFIPNQAATRGTATDLTCGNDPMGCWSPTYGVVDQNYTTRAFPDNSPWDYAFYVVPDTGAHSVGYDTASDELAAAAGALDVQFTAPVKGTATTGFGYPGAQDPKFMYCTDALDEYVSNSTYWYLPGCLLGGGASGGPWAGTSAGPIVSVNSWGWSNGTPGMAGPKLAGTSASCVFAAANDALKAPTNRGYIATCP